MFHQHHYTSTGGVEQHLYIYIPPVITGDQEKEMKHQQYMSANVSRGIRIGGTRKAGTANNLTPAAPAWEVRCR